MPTGGISDDYVFLPEVTDPGEREQAMQGMMAKITEAAQAALPPNVRLWWFCPKCDPEENFSAWFMVSTASVLMDANGIPRCPDCSTELHHVSDEVLDRLFPREKS